MLFNIDLDDNLEEAARIAEARKRYGITEPQPMNTPKNDNEGGKDDAETEKD